MKCAHCGRELNADETGLSRKLISRGTDICFCLGCLSRRFNVTIRQLEELIANFRASGCTLFSPADNPVPDQSAADPPNHPQP